LSTNNGNIEAVLSTLKHRGWRSSATLAKALQELQTVGLIALTRQGGIAAMSKICSLYRFTDEPVFEHPKLGIDACKATFDYLAFESLAQARAALRTLRPEKKRKLQKLMLQASKTEAIAPIKASEIEASRKRRACSKPLIRKSMCRVYGGDRPRTALLQKLNTFALLPCIARPAARLRGCC
jgi:hypothetical protein